jgi:hypothetical protein
VLGRQREIVRDLRGGHRFHKCPILRSKAALLRYVLIYAARVVNALRAGRVVQSASTSSRTQMLILRDVGSMCIFTRLFAGFLTREYKTELSILPRLPP